MTNSGAPALTLANTTAVIMQRYVRILFLSDAPVAVYQYQLFPKMGAEVVASYAVIAGLAALAIFLWRRRRADLFWLAWFLIWIAPSFNIGQLGAYLMAEKLLNLAALGGLVLVVRLVSGLPAPPAVKVLLVGGLAAFHSVTTLEKIGFYRDTRTYLLSALTCAPDFTIARFALGDDYAMTGEHDAALAAYGTVLEKHPNAMTLRRRAARSRYALGGERIAAGDHESALDEYRHAVELDPNLSAAHNNIGNLELMRGRADAALDAWRQATAADPANAEPHYNIGMVLEGRGETAKALAHYRRYLELNPTPPPTAAAHIRELEARSIPTR